MGKVASASDNAPMESFFGSMQIELLDSRTRTTRIELASAIFERIEAFYNAIRHHSAKDYLSPIKLDSPSHRRTKNGTITLSKPSRETVVR